MNNNVYDVNTLYVIMHDITLYMYNLRHKLNAQKTYLLSDINFLKLYKILYRGILTMRVNIFVVFYSS